MLLDPIHKTLRQTLMALVLLVAAVELVLLPPHAASANASTMNAMYE